MKKLTAIVSLLLVMALAMPAYAAINIKGKIAARTALAQNANEDLQFQGQGEVDLSISGNVSSGPVRADINYEIRTGDWGALGTTGNTGFAGQDTGSDYLRVLDAYLTFTGPYIPGGKNLTTRIGRFNNNVTANGLGIIGNMGRRDWVRISGIGVGPATLQLHYGYASTTKTIAAIDGTANIDVLTISGMVVRTDANINTPDNENVDYAVRVVAKPTSDISLQVDYAVDGQTGGADPYTAWSVGGTLSSIENLTLTAKTWTTADEFLPEFRQNNGSHETLLRDRTTPDRQANIGDPYIARGFSVGVNTVQGGLPINASVKTGTVFGAAGLPAAQVAFAGKRMTVVDVGTTIADFGVALQYTTIQDFDPVTDLIVTRKFPGLFVGDVDTRTAVRLRNGVDPQFSADATWKAPNGLNLGLHYANYDRLNDEKGTTGWFGPNIGATGKADGFAVSAEYAYSW